MLPHRIRLRGPWTATNAAGASLTLRAPQEWDRAARLGDGALRLTRTFGWMAALAPHERLWLLVDLRPDGGRLILNGRDWPLAAGDTAIPLAEPLQERNELMIDVAHVAPESPLSLEVGLEVRGQAWLDGLAAERVGDMLRLVGTLRGQADDPLDLYAILHRRVALHASVRADGADAPLDLHSPAIEAGAWAEVARVELMRGAAVWHAAELPVRGS